MFRKFVILVFLGIWFLTLALTVWCHVGLPISCIKGRTQLGEQSFNFNIYSGGYLVKAESRGRSLWRIESYSAGRCAIIIGEWASERPFPIDFPYFYFHGPTANASHSKCRWEKNTACQEHGENEEPIIVNFMTNTLSISFPVWIPSALMVPVPFMLLLRGIRRWRRRRMGLCVHCGYDLRATPDRCPECGREIDSQGARGSDTRS